MATPLRARREEAWAAWLEVGMDVDPHVACRPLGASCVCYAALTAARFECEAHRQLGHMGAS